MTEVRDGQNWLFEALERLLQIPATDLADALKQAAQVMTEALSAGKVDAYLYDAERSELVAVGVSSTPMARREQALSLNRFPLTTGNRIVEVYRTGEPYWTGQADQDPRVSTRIKGKLGVRSMIAVPLDVSGERRGVLAAASAQREAFCAADLRFLQAMAQLMAVVIERIHLQRARAEAVQLAERDRLRADFLATLSHDLQTPLTALRAGLGLLATSVRDRFQPNEQELLESARHNVERLRIRIDNLLTAHEVEAGTLELEPVALDLRTAIERAVTVVQPLLQEKGQLLEVHLPEPLPIVGDLQRLEAVLLDLLANAHRHTPKGTRVMVSGQAATSEVRVTVRDTGPGIPAAQLEAVFAPFHRRAGGGTGLGLANVRAIVALHGGRVWAESGPGQGAAFHVVLPRHDREGEPR
jgi:two-component system, OmpR family, sensor kinase